MGNIKKVDVTHLKSYKAENANVDYPDEYYFSDKDIARYCNKVSKVIIRSVQFVDSVEFIYDDGVFGGIHGNYTGNVSEFTLGEDEYIVSVSWQTANADYYGGYSLKGVVNYIEFKTNKNAVFASSSMGKEAAGWKNRKSFSWEVGEGEEIVGLSGYAGSCKEWLYSLTKVYYRDRNVKYLPNEKYYNDYYATYQCRRLAKIKINHGWVIDKLQFVYTNSKGEVDENITEIHGDGRGDFTEICLEETEYISKIIYKSANTNYYEERVMYYLEFIIMDSVTGEGKCYPFGKVPDWELQEWHHKHTYTLEPEEGYEIFALAGLYRIYLGEIESVYYRKLNSVSPQIKRTAQSLLSDRKAENLNQSDAHILFIHCTRIYNPVSGTTECDEVITSVYKCWKSWKGQNSVRLGQKYNSKDIDILIDNQATNKVVKQALLSGQYRYISIKAHGEQNSIVGIESLPMLSKTMITVGDDAEKFKKALENTVINLFCCNCAYRKDGLAVTLVKNNARACFGFSIPLAFVSSNYDFLISFASYIDNAILIEGRSVNNAAEQMLKQFDSYLDDITKLFNLKKAITNTLNLKVKESETKVKEWLNANTKETEVKKYLIYWYMLRNKAHFCGPGPDKAKSAENNDGEICQDFGDFNYYLALGQWVKEGEKPEKPEKPEYPEDL